VYSAPQSIKILEISWKQPCTLQFKFLETPMKTPRFDKDPTSLKNSSVLILVSFFFLFFSVDFLSYPCLLFGHFYVVK
jgi:hypothetical protein